jgi:hypothetical protein
MLKAAELQVIPTPQEVIWQDSACSLVKNMKAEVLIHPTHAIARPGFKC